MKPGQKVVCINGHFAYPNVGECFSHLPIQGRKYTIREVRPANADGGILLKEIKNEPIYFAAYQGKLEPAFHPSRFKPLDELEKEEGLERIEKSLDRMKLVESN